MQEDNPSWLYAVNNGATTIWEKWDAYSALSGINSRPSLNHYAYGCVVEWMYRYMAGIDYDENVPGFKRVVLAPLPNQMVGSVSATHDSPYGKIHSAWKYEGERFTYNATLPANTTAQIRLPVEEISTLTVNGKNYNAVTAVTDGIEFVSLENGIAVFEAVAGTFSFAAAVTEENYIKIETTGNGGVPVSVKVNGEPVGNAPIKVAPGEILHLSAVCDNFVDYRVAQWSESGRILGNGAELEYTVNGNANLTVNFEKLETENLAKGAAVTANQVNTTWDKSHLTDGKLCHLEGTNGWSSNGQGKNIEFTAPVEAVINLGSVKTVSQFRIYPRTDADAGSEPFNFPVDYVISVSSDNVNWTPVVTVTDGAAVCWKPAVHFLDTAVQAQYIKLSVTAVNRPDGSGNAFVQLSEFTAHNSACNHLSGQLVTDTAPTCSATGTGHKNCLICDVLTESNVVIPTISHTKGDLVTVSAPTCIAKGEGYYTCTKCDGKFEDHVEIPVDPNAHTGNNTEDVNAKEPTCTEKGYTGDTVCECGVTVVKGAEIPMKDHTAGAWKTIKEPTTRTEGRKEQRCTVCNTLLDSKTLPKKAPAVSFTDVKKSDFFYTPVQWAVELGVTTGTSKTTFGPEESCTRAQAVTFLWRAAGQPAPRGSNNPFKDVKKSDYFYKAVLWAAESGVTSGTSKTEFSPNEACTRGQIVTFLWRAQGGKKVNSSNPFTDVKKSDFYYDAVLWAVKNNVTTGTSKTTFAPSAKCTRGQIVTFLYRAVK